MCLQAARYSIRPLTRQSQSASRRPRLTSRRCHMRHCCLSPCHAPSKVPVLARSHDQSERYLNVRGVCKNMYECTIKMYPPLRRQSQSSSRRPRPRLTTRRCCSRRCFRSHRWIRRSFLRPLRRRLRDRREIFYLEGNQKNCTKIRQ